MTGILVLIIIEVNMPKFEPSSPTWKFPEIYIQADKVAKVAFNAAAQTTEITMKPGQSYVVSDGSFGIEVDIPEVIPVKGSEREVREKLGFPPPTTNKKFQI
jgi:hypothetical protein